MQQQNFREDLIIISFQSPLELLSVVMITINNQSICQRTDRGLKAKATEYKFDNNILSCKKSSRFQFCNKNEINWNRKKRKRKEKQGGGSVRRVLMLLLLLLLSLLLLLILNERSHLSMVPHVILTITVCFFNMNMTLPCECYFFGCGSYYKDC